MQVTPPPDSAPPALALQVYGSFRAIVCERGRKWLNTAEGLKRDGQCGLPWRLPTADGRVLTPSALRFKSRRQKKKIVKLVSGKST